MTIVKSRCRVSLIDNRGIHKGKHKRNIHREMVISESLNLNSNKYVNEH